MIAVWNTLVQVAGQNQVLVACNINPLSHFHCDISCCGILLCFSEANTSQGKNTCIGAHCSHCNLLSNFMISVNFVLDFPLCIGTDCSDVRLDKAAGNLVKTEDTLTISLFLSTSRPLSHYLSLSHSKCTQRTKCLPRTISCRVLVHSGQVLNGTYRVN